MKRRFTAYSRSLRKMPVHSEGTFRGTGIKGVTILSALGHYVVALREFVSPTYRPERYYMRGPGPACARRGAIAMNIGGRLR